MNYELAKRYFKTVDETVSYTPTIVLAGIGLVLMFAIKGVGIVLGLLAIALGIFLVVFKKNKIKAEKDSIPSDSQYDAEVIKSLGDLRKKALDKLGIDEDEVREIEPISFDGYVYKGASELKKGADGLWRTNKYECVTLFFSQNEVHCYTYRFDTTGDQHSEETEVYFYKDIVSVSTSSDSATVLEQTIEYEYFKLTTAGGTALQVSLRDIQNAQRSINAMRSLLRAKKQA